MHNRKSTLLRTFIFTTAGFFLGGGVNVWWDARCEMQPVTGTGDFVTLISRDGFLTAT